MNKADITKRIRICHDANYQWEDDCIHIAYLSKSRECLGTEAVTRERMDEIRNSIADGSLFGLPVYAYVHSGATISLSPFDDRWDSGQSGFIYLTKEEAEEIWGEEDTEVRKAAIQSNFQGSVKAFAQYLEGDTWGFVAEEQVELTGQRSDGTTVEHDEWVEVDSCWGFLGSDPKENGMMDHVDTLIEEEGYVFTDEKGEPL
ncbi:MAG: hypothetical protein WC107_07410 [Patescibacteria group bacterium]